MSEKKAKDTLTLTKEELKILIKSLNFYSYASNEFFDIDEIDCCYYLKNQIITNSIIVPSKRKQIEITIIIKKEGLDLLIKALNLYSHASNKFYYAENIKIVSNLKKQLLAKFSEVYIK